MEKAKVVLAKALVDLAVDILKDMKPHIEEFILNDFIPSVQGGVGAIGGFFADLVEGMQGSGMSPAVASALPPKLPDSEMTKRFDIPNMTQALQSASNAYYHDKDNTAKQKAFVQAMVFAAKFIVEAKELVVNKPGNLSISLKDYADLFDFATEVSRFRNVDNLNEILRKHGDLLDGVLRKDLEQAVGYEINLNSPVDPVDAVQFRIDLYAMPQG